MDFIDQVYRNKTTNYLIKGLCARCKNCYGCHIMMKITAVVVLKTFQYTESIKDVCMWEVPIGFSDLGTNF